MLPSSTTAGRMAGPGRLAAALLLGALLGAYPSLAQVTPSAVVLKNKNGVEAHILPVGACIQRLLVPGQDGLKDVMMGFEDVEQYRNGTSVTGCLVGRVGGRISNAQFSLDGVTYKLDANSGGNHTLHGGGIGYNRLNWTVEGKPTKSKVVLSLLSPDGQQNFPGNLTIRVVYTLNNQNELAMDITATTDKATPVNIFSHPYLNLGGFEGNHTVEDHELTIDSTHYLPVNTTGNPTGEIVPVNGTLQDFRLPRILQEGIRNLTESKGYSTTFALFGLGPNAKEEVEGFKASELPRLAASLVHPPSGRGLLISSTAPAFVLYTGNAFKGKFSGKGGIAYQQWAAVALETSMFPDAINQPSFPPAVLRPPGGSPSLFEQRTVWRFFNTDGKSLGGSPLPQYCSAPFPGCLKCRKSGGHACIKCDGLHKLDSKLHWCRPRTCQEAVKGCARCRPGTNDVCLLCRHSYRLLTKTHKCEPKYRHRLR